MQVFAGIWLMVHKCWSSVPHNDTDIPGGYREEQVFIGREAQSSGTNKKEKGIRHKNWNLPFLDKTLLCNRLHNHVMEVETP